MTIGKSRWLLSKLALALGSRPIAEITPQELLTVLKAIERAGPRETARRLRYFASRVFRFAGATARATTDPAQPLLGALVAPMTKHHAAILDQHLDDPGGSHETTPAAPRPAFGAGFGDFA